MINKYSWPCKMSAKFHIFPICQLARWHRVQLSYNPGLLKGLPCYFGIIWPALNKDIGLKPFSNLEGLPWGSPQRAGAVDISCFCYWHLSLLAINISYYFHAQLKSIWNSHFSLNCCSSWIFSYWTVLQDLVNKAVQKEDDGLNSILYEKNGHIY